MSSPITLVPSPRRHAFTIVELMVVIAVIVILIAISTPAFRSAFETSNRAACASNLKQHYGALMGYYNTFNRAFPQSFNSTDAGGATFALYSVALPAMTVTITTPVYTNPLRWNVATNQSVSGSTMTTEVCINLTMMKTYLSGLDFTRATASPVDYPGVIGGVWRCPSADGRDSSIATTYALSPGYIEGWYSYFAMPSWPGSGATATTNQPNFLTTRTPDNKRIMFTDTLFRSSGGAWSYNHGSNGFNDYRISGCDTGAKPTNFAGMNQVWGDGSTRWGFIDPARTTPNVPYDAAAIGTTLSVDWGYAGSSAANEGRNFFILK